MFKISWVIGRGNHISNMLLTTATVASILLLSTTMMTTVTAIECSTVATLLSACSSYVNYGAPDPIPGSPCCDAMSILNLVSDSSEGRKPVCNCLMGLITTYNPNATAVSTLSGFCGVTLGFTIDPNTDCNSIP